MTLSLLKVSDETTQFNFDRIAQRFVDTGGRSVNVRFGVASITGDGTAVKTVTVAHGLGSTPVVVVGSALASDTGGLTTLVVTTQAIDATNLKLTARDSRETVWSSTQSIYWIAIG